MQQRDTSVNPQVIGRMARVAIDGEVTEIPIPSTGVTVGDVWDKLTNFRLASPDSIVALLNGPVIAREEAEYRIFRPEDTLVVLFS